MKRFIFHAGRTFLLTGIGAGLFVGCGHETSGTDNSRAGKLQSDTAIQADLRFSTFDNKTHVASFSVENEENGLRTYRHATTQVLRDAVPQYSVYKEDANLPHIRSGNTAFDALFALAVDEMKLNSVSNIRDGAYNNGEAIPCDCFETGEKWNYVWTRDLSYAAYLSLGMLDPQRVRNSLEFKLSGYRDGLTKPDGVPGSDDGLQIIQDTGSGGSWPISTDRVTWAFGAEAALNSLSGEARQTFAKTALKALSNTVENDRLAAFDKLTGLYTGEQSFLDWREQTYATWIPDDLSSMATAKAVSTNAAQYQALSLTQRLATELGDAARAAKYRRWAEELKTAINTHLWLDDVGLYSSLTASHYDNAAMHKFDWLGQALTIITGITDEQQRQQILANYPHGPMGAPVIFPQQPGVPIYHNRAIWPFVTAYGLKAAKLGNNVAVADSAYDTLIRGAALNLSNMENLEWLSAQPLWTDSGNPDLAGPVINSKRQLWSVGAYLSMVIDNVFGLEAGKETLSISPYITTNLRKQYFAAGSAIQLLNLSWKGKKIDVEIALPPLGGEKGGYSVRSVTLNGKTVGGEIPVDSLSDSNRIRVQLGQVLPGVNAITRVDATPSANDETVFAPYEPSVKVSNQAEKATVEIIDTRNRGDIEYSIYRNGRLVANNLPLGQWVDPEPVGAQACYSAVAVYQHSGNQSHHSRVQCVNEGTEISVGDDSVESNVTVTQQGGQSVLKDWGRQSDTFKLSNIRIDKAGTYALQVKYHNAHHNINTGITCGVKWLNVMDQNGNLVGEGVIQLPHAKTDSSPVKPVYSTPLELSLPEGQYQLSLSDYYNMSYLMNNQTYSATGGETGPANRFDIYAVRVMPLANLTSAHPNTLGY